MLNKKFDKILDSVVTIFILTLFLGTIFVWVTLPDDIPNHLDAAGNIKDYVSKNFLFLLSILGSGLGVASLKLSKHPEMYNYIVRLTPKNREIQYAIATRMIKLLAIEGLLIFGYLEYCMIYAKINSGVYIILMSLFVTLIYYVSKSIKHK